MKLNIEIREDSVRITGYVNAVERLSKPITEPLRGKVRTFLERIKAGVFRKALKRNDDVLVLLNHDKNRVLATTKNNTAKLIEDNIGLRADVTIYDKDVIEKARNNRLVGWSFGFYPNSDELGTDGTNEIRTVTDLDLDEVSILDDSKEPAYYGTSIYARSKESIVYRSSLNEEEENDEEPKTDENQDEEEKKEVTTEETENPSEDTEVSEEEKMDILASKIAEKVVEKMTGAGEEKTIPDKTAEEEGERAFDYSSYEERISKLKRA